MLLLVAASSFSPASCHVNMDRFHVSPQKGSKHSPNDLLVHTHCPPRWPRRCLPRWPPAAEGHRLATPKNRPAPPCFLPVSRRVGRAWLQTPARTAGFSELRRASLCMWASTDWAIDQVLGVPQPPSSEVKDITSWVRRRSLGGAKRQRPIGGPKGFDG